MFSSFVPVFGILVLLKDTYTNDKCITFQNDLHTSSISYTNGTTDVIQNTAATEYRTLETEREDIHFKRIYESTLAHFHDKRQALPKWQNSSYNWWLESWLKNFSSSDNKLAKEDGNIDKQLNKKLYHLLEELKLTPDKVDKPHEFNAVATSAPWDFHYDSEVKFQHNNVEEADLASYTEDDYAVTLPEIYDTTIKKGEKNTTSRKMKTTTVRQEKKNTTVRKPVKPSIITKARKINLGMTLSTTRNYLEFAETTQRVEDKFREAVSDSVETETFSTRKEHVVAKLRPSKNEAVMVKRVKGVWVSGECRCNYLLRSNAFLLAMDSYFILYIITLLLLMN